MLEESDIRVLSVGEADPSLFAEFLEQAFGPGMSRFIVEHGEWMHRGSQRRYVATVDGVYAGYRAMIPASVAFRGVETTGVWAVGLYVLPRFRGLGLQRLLDARVAEAAPLRMSFPGELGASIYSKQGYGVRQDLWEWHMPLAPMAYWKGRRATWKGVMRQAPAAARAGAFRSWLRYHCPTRTELLDQPDPGVLEGLFRRYADPGCVTTVRDAAFLEWRYLRAPYREDLGFYLTRRQGIPSHYAIVRHGASRSAPARVLDLFGDFEDPEGMNDLVRAILVDAGHRERSHASILVSLPSVARVARGCGFFPINPYRFRWAAEVSGLQEGLRTAPLYWTLGDSDNDLQGVALF